NSQYADQEDPVIGLCHVEAEYREGIGIHCAHPGDTAKCHQECADAADKGPRAWINNMIVVFLSMGAGHVIPRSSLFLPSRRRLRSSWSADEMYRKALWCEYRADPEVSRFPDPRRTERASHKFARAARPVQ